MHFALPPKRTLPHSPMYKPRSSRGPLFRRSRIKFLVLCLVALGALLFLLSKIVGGLDSTPSGTPPVVIVTVLEPGVRSQRYLDDVKANREQYARKHGTFPSTSSL